MRSFVVAPVVCAFFIACSSSGPEPRQWDPAEDHPAEPEGDSPRALPEGPAVPMPRDGEHPGESEGVSPHEPGGGAPQDAVHSGGGGGMPQDAVHGGGGGDAPGLELEWQVPEGWRAVPPASAMRKAEWVLPRAEGDAEDASLVVFYFGSGQGGDVESNLERWYGQFEQPDGRPTREVARLDHRTVSGMRVTIADVTGTFSGGMPGGPPAAPRPETRMLAAIAEAPSGPWFFKLVGPKRTVDRWRDSFDTFVASLRPAGST